MSDSPLICEKLVDFVFIKRDDLTVCEMVREWHHFYVPQNQI
jgi:hypothetical protein